MESKLMNNEQNKEENIPSSVEVHSNVQCDSCGVCPIKGIRYKCMICENFDYCEKCEEEKGSSHGHPFLKLRYKIN